jgi:hypothetical protein
MPFPIDSSVVRTKGGFNPIGFLRPDPKEPWECMVLHGKEITVIDSIESLAEHRVQGTYLGLIIWLRAQETVAWSLSTSLACSQVFEKSFLINGPVTEGAQIAYGIRGVVGGLALFGYNLDAPQVVVVIILVL